MTKGWRFVQTPQELISQKYVASNQLPHALGGSSDWNLRRYVKARCVLEGVLCKLPAEGLLGPPRVSYDALSQLKGKAQQFLANNDAFAALKREADQMLTSTLGLIKG